LRHSVDGALMCDAVYCIWVATCTYRQYTPTAAATAAVEAAGLVLMCGRV